MGPLLELIEIEDNGIYQDAQHESYLAKKILDIGYEYKLF